MSSKYAFSKGLREVRFLFCQTSEHSTAVRYVCHLASAHLLMRKSLMQPPPLARTFLNRAYPTMKKNNPQIPILIREASGTVPKVYARYGTLDPSAATPRTRRLHNADFPVSFGRARRRKVTAARRPYG